MDFPENSGWKANQEHAALLLASGSTVEAAAEKVEVTTRTIYNWLCVDEYKTYVDQLRIAMLSEALGVLTAAATSSARTMVELLTDEESSIRLRASQAILDTIGKLREHIEFDRRISALEGRHESAIAGGAVGAVDAGNGDGRW
jgi:uncharacterized Zn finger protein